MQRSEELLTFVELLPDFRKITMDNFAIINPELQKTCKFSMLAFLNNTIPTRPPLPQN